MTQHFSKIFQSLFTVEKYPKYFYSLFTVKKIRNIFSHFLLLKNIRNIFSHFLALKKFGNIFSHFLLLKNFILTYQLLFFCRQKWKVISRDHELWEVKFDLKTGFQTLLSFFLVGLFSRPRYQKYSPWTGEFILGHRGTHKCVTTI